MSVAPDTAGIFRQAALAAYIQGSHGKPLCHIPQFVVPVAAAACIPVKMQDRRMLFLSAFSGSQVLGMNPCPTDPLKIEVKAFCEGGLKVRRYQFYPGLQRAHLFLSAVPIGIEIRRAGISSGVQFQLFQGHFKYRHREFLREKENNKCRDKTSPFQGCQHFVQFQVIVTDGIGHMTVQGPVLYYGE
ncbi:MAG: hypothetical protein BWY09_03020 [Candidatus Hydrogenedentes bacterium ADurb.Bin179]|nr:MAG: hypothetical protein BWY09_03020 [Candidatus Hydrogenedentes bacterium ADurb.Bin179]